MIFKSVHLNRLNSLMIVFSFMTLWLSVYLDSTTESFLSYFLILSIGIIHGANDIRLIESKKMNVVQKIAVYVLFVLVTAFLFFQFIAVATFLFIVLSAYHFGEQHWEIRLQIPQKLSFLYYASYGILIFAMLFGMNTKESIPIIGDLTGVFLSTSFFKWIGILAGSIWLFLSGYFVYQKQKPISFWIQEFFFILVFGIIFITASLIWAFAIYFIVWHSLPSLISQLYYIYGKANKKEVYKYVKSSLIYWLGAILFLLGLYYLLNDYMDFFLSILVAFLAAITLPHSFVMNKMFHSKS